MSERDDLADVISEAENSVDAEGEWALAEDIADAILAAGYRKMGDLFTGKVVGLYSTFFKSENPSIEVEITDVRLDGISIMDTVTITKEPES